MSQQPIKLGDDSTPGPARGTRESVTPASQGTRILLAGIVPTNPSAAIDNRGLPDDLPCSAWRFAIAPGSRGLDQLQESAHRSHCPRPRPYVITLWSRALVLALMPWFINCSSDNPPQVSVIVPTSSSATPLSANSSVALVDEHTACVIVSYETEVRCLARTGELAGVFGREGDGPGEFRFAHALMRGPRHTVAVIDPLASRLSVFTPAGELVAEVAIPEVFEPMSPIGETMIGTYAPNLRSTNRVLAEFDLAGGAVLWRRELRTPSDIGLPGECGLSWGAMSLGGVATFGACHSQLLFYSASGDGEVGVIEAPTYGPAPLSRTVGFWGLMVCEVVSSPPPAAVERGDERARRSERAREAQRASGRSGAAGSLQAAWLSFSKFAGDV